MSWRWLLVLLTLILTIASAIAVVKSRQESRRLFIELNQLERERDELNTEFGRLQLEQATLTDSSRLEQFASSQMGMIYPGPAETVVIRR
ncbi:cell division protein FtsL [Ahniella affigens]|uniref:Cell division protein FtsL n=1 Tax=Ahniella affigens TaxID=2021234 RepID=A0A2P1PM38_9GAMM|nr:cell division protein FtsL [Ahniella affigens]AVP95911.1 cell division protein FtsL [Ahniella affigens]